MADRDRNVIDLNARRAREAERRRAEEEARKTAQRAAASRRRLAEHGPTGSHAGSLIGRIISWLVIVVAIGSVVLIVAQMVLPSGRSPGPLKSAPVPLQST
jgi:hypothetical protein